MPAAHAASHPMTSSHAMTGAYLRLLLMMVLSFVAMYALMYAMVDAFDNVYLNINKAYMAGLMTAPMLVFELLVMGSMYPSRKLNMSSIAIGIVALAILWAAIRGQAGVGDREFLRSMIPHHASAILMCGKAPVADPEIKSLCASIVESQQREIDQMKRILARLDAGD